MEERLEAGSFTKFYALLLLSKKPMSGYGLMAEIGRAFGKKPSSGQIYPLLAKMEEAGYTAAGKVGEREKKMYSLTARGREAIGDLVERTSSIVDAVLEQKLVECEHCGCVIYERAYRKMVHGKVHNFCCKSCASERGHAKNQLHR